MTDTGGPIRVAFGRLEVAIHASDPEVHATLLRDHRHMRGSSARPTGLTLSIVREGDRFLCSDSVGAREARPTARWAVRWARHRLLEAMVVTHPELFWLHGGAAGVRDGALLVIGPRGRGKSTLVTALCAGGVSYLSDDVLPVDPEAFVVHPFPRAPEVRADPGEEMPPAWLFDVSKTEVLVDDCVEQVPRTIRGLLVPRAGRSGGNALTPCSPAEAVVEIAQCAWNFADHGPRAAATVGRLASAIPVMRIAFDDAPAAARLVLAWSDSLG